MVFEQEVNIRSGKLKSALKSTETAIEQLSDSISLKASASDVYTKQQTQAILEVKANKDTLISEINASADQVKINADKININGVVTIGGLARTTDIPTNVSELNNDSGYTTTADIPTKVSDLTNDSNFATEDQIPTNVSDLANDLNYATTSQVPTRVSQLSNDSGFQNATQVDSAIVGKGYATTTQAQGYANTAQQNAIDAIPENLSDFTNDADFQNATQVESTITSKGYQDSTQVADAISDGISGKADAVDIPNKVSDLDNDSAFQTLDDVNAVAQATLNIASGDATAKANEAAKTATDNITRIGEEGVWVTPTNKMPSDPKSGEGATGSKVDSDGFHVYKDGAQVASYGDEAIVGKEDEFHTVNNSEEVAVYNGEKKISSFGKDGISLGSTDSGIRNVITNTRQAFRTDSGDIAWFGLNDEGIWEMHIAVTYAEDMIRFGNFAWIKRDNGNMTIKWIGE